MASNRKNENPSRPVSREFIGVRRSGSGEDPESKL